MHAFSLRVFSSSFEKFTAPLPTTEAEFLAQNSYRAESGLRVVSVKRPRLKIGDRVLIKVGRVPKKHNTGHTLEEGYAKILGVAILDDGLSAQGVHTRVMYHLKFETPVEWIDIESDWKATAVIVQESSLMVRA